MVLKFKVGDIIRFTNSLSWQYKVLKVSDNKENILSLEDYINPNQRHQKHNNTNGWSSHSFNIEIIKSKDFKDPRPSWF